MPDLVTVQLDDADALAGQLGGLGAELAAEGSATRGEGARLGQALSGPAGEHLAATGLGWGGLVESLAARTQDLATVLTGAVASYRAVDALVSERVGAGPHAAIAR
ncbi:hypothetical protein [Modestobacter sp. Leaf380]|uniref:hypothetical protein n=1 Tax=Modestobacter sp. Leaf380 TaxID=1736356 RepID=UPI0009E7077D|nr:hypothetical protein [Modestobacter sp. Leaf380]